MFARCMYNFVKLGIKQQRQAQQQQQITAANLLVKRAKNTYYQGVKGIRSRKSIYLSHNNNVDNHNKTMDYEVEESAAVANEEEHNREEESMMMADKTLDLEELAYDEVVGSTMHVERDASRPHNVLIIQPYVKWCPNNNKIKTQNINNISPDDKLHEAEALIRSLPNWNVALALKVPLESLERKMLFGRGKLQELRTIISDMQQQKSSSATTMLFVSKGQLTFMQKRLLEQEFNLPVMDRYSIVIQILRLHATSAESRLQVAMAEIPYIWSQTKDQNNNNNNNKRHLYYSLTDTQRDLLRNRERKLKQELARIRNQRQLLRNKRQQKQYPVVAVVGYTNTGKTSLIKALTQEKKLQPKNKLFATLDVTAHSGLLPCQLEVIYMDTIGFMSDLPTGLFECFIATLEDVMLADVIVHVQDVAHECWLAQSQHVNHTLNNLAKSIASNGNATHLPPIISVGNKIDLLHDHAKLALMQDNQIMAISSAHNIGLGNLLMEIERQILKSTNRLNITIRVRSGGQDMAWLYKNSAVVDIHADDKSAEHLLMHVVITETSLQQFKRNLNNAQ